jgi:peptidyl-prolyl cis-trans isomerase C
MFSRLFSVSICAAVLISLLPSSLRAEDDPLVAKVNGVEIRLSDLEGAKRRMPPQFQQIPMERLRKELLASAINGILLVAEASKQNLEEDEDFKRRMAAIRDQFIERVYMGRYLDEHLNEDMIKKRYEERLETIPLKEEVSARHILLKDEKTAKEIIAELEKGADFIELAKSRSTGPTAGNGGDLGFFKKNEMVPPFAKAAFAMEKGAVSKAPVKTRFGWHIIKVEDKREAKASLEKMRGSLQTELAREVAEKHISELREKAEIERF